MTELSDAKKQIESLEWELAATQKDVDEADLAYRQLELLVDRQVGHIADLLVALSRTGEGEVDPESYVKGVVAGWRARHAEWRVELDRRNTLDPDVNEPGDDVAAMLDGLGEAE